MQIEVIRTSATDRFFRCYEIELTPPDPDRAFVIAALARAALELGNPTNAAFNIDPLKETPSWILYLSGFLYMAKTGVRLFCINNGIL